LKIPREEIIIKNKPPKNHSFEISWNFLESIKKKYANTKLVSNAIVEKMIDTQKYPP
jgi:hypothetical protein